MRIVENPRRLARVIALSSAIGAASGSAVTGGATRGLLQGALSGVLIAVFVHLTDVPVDSLHLSRWRFGLYVAANALLTAAAICAGFALHSGVVVAGEISDLRREIAYIGETVNTAARIEALAKEVGKELVASEDVLRHAALPPDLVAESLGAHRLRGKERALELFAVERR